MIELEALTHPGGTVPLGEVCDFAVRAHRPDVETRVFLKDGRIFYLEPLSDWARRGAVRLFPDAPGAYTLAVEWRGGGDTGWAELRFEVVAGLPGGDGDVPRQVTVDERTRLWVPSDWEARQMPHHERATMDLLRRVVAPGAVVYDVGAHLGLYAVQLARLVGPAGRVYCLEANPVCVAFLEANLTLNAVENAEILPVAVTDGRRVEFTVNYHNGLVGMNAGAVYAGVDVFAGTGPRGRWRRLLGLARGRAAAPGPVTPHRGGTPGGGKAGHRIAMRGRRLDDLIQTYGLRPPDLVKVDIEGGEVLAVPGMRRTLARRRPVLLVELHGQAAARQTLRALAPMPYRYEVTPDGPRFDEARALIDWFPDACLQVLAHPA